MSRVPTVAAAVLLAACNAGSSGQLHDGEGEKRGGTVTVFAAASLTEAFTDLGAAFEREHRGVKVIFNFAGSQSLRTQIEQGAQPDVFASANPRHMSALVEAELVAAPAIFAHNRMVIAVPPANPARISELADLPRAERLVLAGTNVPAGAYAEKVFARLDATRSGFAERVAARVVSREMHVRQVLQKVILGEADAAVVYATDAASAGKKITIVDIPDELNVVADYPIAAVQGASRPGLGERFTAFVRSQRGREILAAHGFVPADAAGLADE
jgi:molybdate transport system substrate-binding protein